MTKRAYAYERSAKCDLVAQLRYIPVVPPLRRGANGWHYNREKYRKRNEVKRLFAAD